MEALVLDLGLARVAALRLFHERWPAGPRGPLVPLRHTTRYPRPELPGDDWVRIRPTLSGVCGTDLAVIRGRESPFLSPFASFPCVPGHEVVGRVAETGARAREWVGRRVVVDPVLGCRARGLDPCPSCSGGLPSRCGLSDQGRFSPGLLIGFCRDLPGGWAEEMVAHRSQLHAVPEGVADRAAVLVEPLAVGWHAVLRDPPRPGERVVVVGAGTIGLAVVHALRHLASGVDVTLVARYPFQAAWGERMGVRSVVGDVRGAAVSVAGARRLRPIFGPDVLSGGFDRAYDCVGSPRTLRGAVGSLVPGGTLVLVGGAAEATIDWTPVWAREIAVLGSYAYGWEPAAGAHTFELVLEALARDGADVAEWVTHAFALGEWRRALEALTSRRRAGRPTVKVAFRLG
ncbi:MAG: alcohol dehydrogenase catalytic domain-containing protein [Clostridia bacterium]|nr:alcohol dehydrogenase catalytic domain-containing protein [Clostridia bacterium]